MQVRALLCDAAEERAVFQYCDAHNRTSLSPHDNVDAQSVLKSVNPKVLYHRAFAAPTMLLLTDVQDYFHIDCSISLSEIESETSWVIGDYNGCVDDNLFPDSICIDSEKPN